jgi:hypothetical protein
MSEKSESGGTGARSEDFRVSRFAHFSLVPLIPRFYSIRACLAFLARRARGEA